MRCDAVSLGEWILTFLRHYYPSECWELPTQKFQSTALHNKSQKAIFTLSETVISEGEAHTSAPTSTPAAQCITARKNVQSASGWVRYPGLIPPCLHESRVTSTYHQGI